MVQFGDVFGVFRLLDDDNDLPMTQALDVPETPISTKHISKLNKVPVTTIPESPDVSDRVSIALKYIKLGNDSCLIYLYFNSFQLLIVIIDKKQEYWQLQKMSNIIYIYCIFLYKNNVFCFRMTLSLRHRNQKARNVLKSLTVIL
jgi:hypothetical protein